MDLVVKNPSANTGDIRDVGSVPGSRWSPGGHGNPLQYSRLENPMDRGAWQAIIHEVSMNQTRVKQLSIQSHTLNKAKQTVFCFLEFADWKGRETLVKSPWKEWKITNWIEKFKSGEGWRMNIPIEDLDLGCCCCCWVTSVVSDSVRPQRRQPTRLPCPWDPPGKNTGVGCHFLHQCMKVKSESEVAQSCPTLSDPMDCSPPGSSVHGIFQARVLECGAIAFSET